MELGLGLRVCRRLESVGVADGHGASARHSDGAGGLRISSATAGRGRDFESVGVQVRPVIGADDRRAPGRPVPPGNTGKTPSLRLSGRAAGRQGPARQPPSTVATLNCQ